MSVSQRTGSVAVDIKSQQQPPVDRKSTMAGQKKPEQDLADRVQNEFSNCCAKYEYCGEVFKHEIHWTEWLFALLLVTSAILLIVVILAGTSKKPIPTSVFGILVGAVAFIAFVFLWNFAKTKTLASLARRLKSLVAETKANTKKHEENNKMLAQENEKIQESLAHFKESVGLVDSAVKDIDAVENKLNELLRKHHVLIEEQKKFDSEHEAFLQLQESNRLYLKKEQSKSRVRDQFSYADMNRDGALTTAKEKEKMKEYVTQAGFTWGDDWDKDGDGGIRLWELMVQLDKQTGSVFSFDRVKSVASDNKKLEEELASRKKDLASVRPESKTIALEQKR